MYISRTRVGHHFTSGTLQTIRGSLTSCNQEKGVSSPSALFKEHLCGTCLSAFKTKLYFRLDSSQMHNSYVFQIVSVGLILKLIVLILESFQNRFQWSTFKNSARYLLLFCDMVEPTWDFFQQILPIVLLYCLFEFIL